MTSGPGGRPLRFGAFFAPFHPVGQNPTLALERDLDLLVHLDSLGFDEAWIGSSRVLAVTGTHLSTPSTRESVLQAMRWARARGCRVVLDIDYRPVLWGLAGAGAGESEGGA